MRRTIAATAAGALLLAALPASAGHASTNQGENLTAELAVSVIKNYQENRTATATAEQKSQQALPTNRYSQEALKSLNQDKNEIGQLKQNTDSDKMFDRSTVDVKVDGIKTNGDTATVNTTDTTRLKLRNPNQGVGDYASESRQRCYTFKRVNGTWQLEGAKENDNMTPEQRQMAGPAAADVLGQLPSKPAGTAKKFKGKPDSPEIVAKLAKIPGRADKTPGNKPSKPGNDGQKPGEKPSEKPGEKPGDKPGETSSVYDRKKAVAYAWKHVYFHNKKQYPTWRNVDCTNFVSQVLNAGGWSNVPGAFSSDKAWYFKGGTQNPSPQSVKTSLSWINASKLGDFMRANPDRAVMFRDPANAKVGDIVQFKWSKNNRISHSAVVTGVTAFGLLVTYHSADKLNQPLNAIMRHDPNAEVFFYSPR
ncbi:Putative amidase domain [Dermatophilus congolensis]|uniref:Putative amidase domain n=1 Tax=Dermatophilus congolensis TaxID=1863 RepID=A0A239VA05_9MICO|nr:amidase domain-containing protein [Dermatophilus congolensis]SNV18947.1 Putative amidase domain [Dermatophilus congolensis]